MYNILVIDQGAMDLHMTEDILLQGFKNVAVFCAEDLKQAIPVLEGETVNLVIVDIDRFTLLIHDFLRLARMHHPALSVLLTSVMREEELLPMVMKLNASAYLLKPFRAHQLLAAASPLLMEAQAAEEKAGLAEQQAHLTRLHEACQEFSYQQAADIVKKYLDFLYQSTDNMALIRIRVMEFAGALAALKDDLDPDLRRRLSGSLERFRSRFDIQSNKYRARVILEGMLDIIFAAMEREAFYADDLLKKALNYIDRNMKKGVKLDDAANYVNMSPSYFSKFFKRNSGVNFIDYVTERKITYAKDMLLDTDIPVSNIAYELSFRETNYFSKAFKKKVGLTPSEYREQNMLSR